MVTQMLILAVAAVQVTVMMKIKIVNHFGSMFPEL